MQGRCTHSKSVSSLLASAVSLVSKKPYLGIAAAQRLRPSGLQVLEKGKFKEGSLHSFWDTHTETHKTQETTLRYDVKISCEKFPKELDWKKMRAVH